MTLPYLVDKTISLSTRRPNKDILLYTEKLLVTLNLVMYCGLHCQKTDSIRVTRCWLWFCTDSDNPFPVSCWFRNVGVHVTFDVNRPHPIHFVTKDTLSNSSTDLEKSAPGVWNTPPSPIVGPLLVLIRAWWEKKFSPWKIILPGRRGQLQCDMGIKDRVSAKIWVD